MLLVIVVITISCSKDEMNENATDENQVFATSNLTVVTEDSFIGNWSLTQLTADNAVDLNNDGTGNTDLMVETNCFNTSGVIFRADGTFTVNNKRLDFNAGASNDEFSCGSDSEMSGSWEVEDNNLVLHFNIDGTNFTQSKSVDLNETTFSFEVSKFESDQYVGDAQGTVMEDTEIISLEYTRVQ